VILIGLLREDSVLEVFLNYYKLSKKTKQDDFTKADFEELDKLIEQ